MFMKRRLAAARGADDATNVPSLDSRSTPRSAWTVTSPSAYDLRRSSTRMSGAAASVSAGAAGTARVRTGSWRASRRAAAGAGARRAAASTPGDDRARPPPGPRAPPRTGRRRCRRGRARGLRLAVRARARRRSPGGRARRRRLPPPAPASRLAPPPSAALPPPRRPRGRRRCARRRAVAAAARRCAAPPGAGVAAGAAPPPPRRRPAPAPAPGARSPRAGSAARPPGRAARPSRSAHDDRHGGGHPGHQPLARVVHRDDRVVGDDVLHGRRAAAAPARRGPGTSRSGKASTRNVTSWPALHAADVGLVDRGVHLHAA